ncbi:uncharacterized protein LOC129809370 [Phlebotomus papatasi]|uniref:uncharacterized protein LOC129809370 n=1 Tax=Phlebotomus papatasi TaxID=29031 RepID=UPI0024841945|nr:uncharacterized protein LOC129809370 [Phlebotomus papatasi]
MDSIERHLFDAMFGLNIPLGVGKPLCPEKLDKMRGRWQRKSILEIHLSMSIVDMEMKPKKSLDEIRSEMENIGGGICKKVISEGFGSVTKDKPEITIQYVKYGQMLDSDKIELCDSTYIAQKPYTFVLGSNCGLLLGFEKAVRSMRNQEKAEFIMSEQKNGNPPVTRNVMFIIEVIRVADVMVKQDRVRLHNNYPETMRLVQELRDKGKDAFTAQFYRVAADMYTEVVSLLRNVLVQTETDNNKRLELLLKMYLYAGMTYNKLEQAEFAYLMLINAVNLLMSEAVSVSNVLMGKIYLHAARANRMLNDIQESFVFLTKAEECIGNAPEVLDEYKKLFQIFHKACDMDAIGKTVCRAVDKGDDGVENNHSMFVATFDHILKTFMCGKDKSKTVYGLECNEHVPAAMKLAAKYKKIKLEVNSNDSGTIAYSLTRK